MAKGNEQNYKKLIKYKVSLLDHFKWKQKDQYISQLFKLEYEIQNLVEELKLDFEKLKEFKLNSISKGFSKFLKALYSACRIFEPDPDL